MPDYRSMPELPPTLHEQQMMRDREVMSLNAERERRRLYEANRAAGHPTPRVGDKLHVQLDSSVSRRGRAGIRFERGKRITLEIVDVDENGCVQGLPIRTDRDGHPLPNLNGTPLAQLQRDMGLLIISVEGAEAIYEDSALHKSTYADSSSFEDMTALAQRNAQLEEELQLARVENKKLREARQAAGESKQGEPARLQAAAKAKTADTTPEFGSTDKK